MSELGLNLEFFSKNRETFAAKMKPNSVAVFVSNDSFPRNGDQFFPYRQSSDFFYLTGIRQEESMLVLSPDAKNPKLREVLFILKPTPELETWNGRKLRKEEAKLISGAKMVTTNDTFWSTLNELLVDAEHIYLNANEYPKYSTPVPYHEIRFTAEIKKKYPLHTFERAAPLLWEQRLIKSEAEIACMQKACDITGDAFKRLLGFIRPGVWEYQIQAELEHEFKMQGAMGNGYQPIIGSGINACYLHYLDNNKQCEEGELVLMDFGAEYNHYSADLTRTVPVSGTFSKRQKECYDAVQNVQAEAIKLFKPGNTIDELNKEVDKLMIDAMHRIGLLTKEETAPGNKAYKKYFMHGTSHYLGLDVHDVGSKYEPFSEGMIFTCEPGLYIQEEGFGIRLENDILVTDNGPVDLMANIPIKSDDIEEIMEGRG